MSRLYDPLAYLGILEVAKEQGYRFATFADYDPAGGKQIILRHDIDCLPSLARQMAELDHAAGARSTFCFMVDSALYNPLSQEDGQDLREIVGLGHELGLHLDANAWLSDEQGVSHIGAWLDYGRLIAKRQGYDPKVVSWHSPPKRWMAEVGDWHPRGMLNALHRSFVRDGMYVSDSNCRHSSLELCEMLRSGSHPHIQMLLHPLIWMVGGRSMDEIWARFWARLIHDRERFILRTNQAYRSALPRGLLKDVVQRFAEEVMSEMDQGRQS